MTIFPRSRTKRETEREKQMNLISEQVSKLENKLYLDTKYINHINQTNESTIMFRFKLHCSFQGQGGSMDPLTSSLHQEALAKDSINSWYPSGTVACVCTHPANAGTSAFTSKNLASKSSRWKSAIRFTKGRLFALSR